MVLESIPHKPVAYSEYCYITMQEIIRKEYMWNMMALYISKFVKIIHEVQSFKWVHGTAKEASKHKHTAQHGDIMGPRFWACLQRSCGNDY